MLKLTRLKETRELAGLSQDELAITSGVARATVADLELGKRVAQPRTARRLAEALGVEIRELLEESVVPLGEAPPAHLSGGATRGIRRGDPRLGVPEEEVTRAFDMLLALHKDAREQLANWRRALDEAVEQDRPLYRQRPYEMMAYQARLAKEFVKSFKVFDQMAQYDGLSSPNEWPPKVKTATYEAGVFVQALGETAFRIAEENERLRSGVRERVLAEEFSAEEMPAKLTEDPEWNAMLQEVLAGC